MVRVETCEYVRTAARTDDIPPHGSHVVLAINAQQAAEYDSLAALSCWMLCISSLLSLQLPILHGRQKSNFQSLSMPT